jgi:UDP-N-acetylglucosamine 1-carboxyvinyltransferase
MSKFIIQGRNRLSGEIEVFGAKNEATKLVAAAILTKEDVVIKNAPDIVDFVRMLDIIKSMGARVDHLGEHEVLINCRDIDPDKMDHEIIKKLRASVVLIGPLLARFGQVKFPTPGGCIIGNRPLETHFQAFEDLGAVVEEDIENNFYEIKADELKSGEVVLSEFSVTASENIMMAAVFVPGKTRVKIMACEPHVVNLSEFLNKMGAKIKWIGSHEIEIEGVSELHKVEHTVIPDTIDAGTFLILAAATKSQLTVKNAIATHMDLFLKKLKEFGVKMEIKSDEITIFPAQNLRAVQKIETNIYPGIPTDLQQPLTLLATQANGTTLVFEKMYENRFNFVSSLNKMGANIEILDPHRILVNGATPLQGIEAKSFDLRAGATLVIAGLLADGETIINEAELVERGYENVVERLRSIGADIKKIED